MSKRVTLFLPAAGLGERLRPITEHLPKPLLPVLGRPVIEIILGRVAHLAGNIGINLHHRPELIRDWVMRSPYAGRLTFFHEDPILGTGGALKNAAAFLSGCPFLVHNADILLDMDFARLIEAHLSSGNIATLATHRHPKLSNVVVDENGRVMDVENPGESRTEKPDGSRPATRVAYTGVAVYSPEILDFLPEGVSHATSAWLAAGAAGRTVQALDVTGSPWADVGTPASYAAAVLDALSLEGEMVYRSPSASCATSEADGYVVLESGSMVENGARLRNCIVMPGVRVSGGHENRIIGPGYAVDLSEAGMQPPLHAAQNKTVSLSDALFADYLATTGGPPPDSRNITAPALFIGFGGSDRRYYRVRTDGGSAVLMECRPDDDNFQRHIEYTRFFASHGIPVPELLAVDSGHKRALFEDLGDTSLYASLKLVSDRRRITDTYRRVMEILSALHGRATRRAGDCPFLLETVFDYNHLRWETTYFLEQFVQGLRGMVAHEPSALEEEFHRLAMKVDAFPKTIVHRDFQSQNIMAEEGGSPRVIDYQGARMGPPAYDLASVLWDPYARLDDGMREELLAHYVETRKSGDEGFSADDFRGTLLPCRLQRHMQALGAYAFLSQAKGKRYFLKHVPEGLRLLREDASGERGDFPALFELVERLHG